jgi:hypothetical protein
VNGYLVRRADDGRAVSTLRVGLAAIRAAHHLAGIPLDLRQPAFAMALTLADVTAVPGRGFLLTIGRSKTDQQGRGEPVAIAANPADPGFCSETALQAWLVHRHQAADLAAETLPAARDARPLFCAVSKSGRVTGTRLSDKAVVRLVKQAAADAGFDAGRFAGHSLRAGLPALMRQTRHRSTAVALGYLRPAELWTQNVSSLVFAAAGGPQEG